MTVAVEDRIVDYALLRLYGRVEDVDLSERIVDAWERGERGSDLADLLEPSAPAAPRRPEAPPAVARRLGWWPAAAAAGLAAAAGIAWFLLRDPGDVAPIPLARSLRPVEVLRGTGSLETREVLADDVAKLLPEESLDLAGGGRIASDSGAVLDFRADSVRLLRGRVDLEGDGETVVETGVLRATARRGAQASLAVAFPADADEAVGALEPSVVAALRASLSEPSSTRIAVESGEVWIAHRGGTERVVAGTIRVMRRPAKGLPAGEDEGKANESIEEWLLALGRPIPNPEEWSWEEMSAAFEKDPALWRTLGAALERRVGQPGFDPRGFQMVVHFALACATGEGLPFVRDLWMRHPEGFTDIEIAALAERGQFEFEREAESMVQADAPGRPATFAACWLARRGDARAVALLARDVERLRPDRYDDDFLRLVYAGFVLGELGDADAHRAAVEAACGSVEAQLRGGFVLSASMCVRVLTALDAAEELGRPVPIETFLAELRENTAPYADAAAVREALDRLARPR